MSYASKDIRNIALLGHGGNGKTSLAESILFLTGVTDRLGSTAAGNSVSDYDQEEIRRQISISASTMYTEYQKTKINIIDTPGYFDFAGEVIEALRAADAAIIDSLMAGAMIGEGTSSADMTSTVALTSEEYGVGFRKGSDLAAALNDFFAASWADGTMQTLADTYGVTAALIPQE